MSIKATGIIGLLGLVAFASCKTSHIQGGANSPYKALLGKWRWVQSTGGFAGKTTTPQAEGHTMHIEFKADTSVIIYRDDAVTGKAKFEVVKGRTIFSQDSAYLLKFQPQMIDEAILKVTKDTLVLADNVHDGFGKTYVKQ